jgi:hypothetical protein
MTKARVVRRVAAFAGIVLFVALSTWAAACLDLTPVTEDQVVTIPIALPDVQRPPVPDGSARDASGDAGPLDAAILPPCESCFMSPDMPGPGCATEFHACLANPQCALAYACVLDMGCLLGLTQQQLILCATPCITEAGGITSQTSEAGVAVTNAATCLTTPPPGCGNLCATGM